MDSSGCSWTKPSSVTPASRPVRQLRTDLDGRNLATDQKVGGSSPSERAQLTSPLPDPAAGFFVALGATLGATDTRQPPNRARVIDSAAARLSPSSRCPYTSLVMAMLACPRLRRQRAAACPGPHQRGTRVAQLVRMPVTQLARSHSRTKECEKLSGSIGVPTSLAKISP
jgi:hypothetical protein